MKPDQERVHSVIKETITLLCKKGLNFGSELKIEGVVGVTVDRHDIFIVHINELINVADSSPESFGSERASSSYPRNGGSTTKVRAVDLPPMMPAARMQQFNFPSPGVRPAARPNFAPPNSRMSLPRMARRPQRMDFRNSVVAHGRCRMPPPGPPSQQVSMLSSRSASFEMPVLQKVSSQKMAIAAWNSPPALSVGMAGETYMQRRMEEPKSDDTNVILVEDHDPLEQTEMEKIESGDPVCRDNDSSILEVKPDAETGALYFNSETDPAETRGKCDLAGEELLSNDLQNMVKQENQDLASALLLNAEGMSDVGNSVQKETTDEQMAAEMSLYLQSSQTDANSEEFQDFQDFYSQSDLSSHEMTDEDWEMDQETTSDPDWSESEKKKKKSTPKKAASQVRAAAAGCQQNSGQRSAAKRRMALPFSEIPQATTKCASRTAERGTVYGGDDDSWKMVARFVCNLAGCGASFNQKYNLVRHQKQKHDMVGKRR